MELKTKKNCHAKYNLERHLIMVTKYRKKCITEEMFLTLKEQMEKVLAMNGGSVEEMSYESDHVHVLMELPPQACLSRIINGCKTSSSKKMRLLYGDHLKQFYWKPYFWSRSYLILSSGGAPIEVIKRYIRNQERDASI